MIQPRHTICTPAGRIVITASATRASVQVAFFPADRSKMPCGFLIPNASAGIVALALEAVATLNEESTPPELPADLGQPSPVLEAMRARHRATHPNPLLRELV